MFGLGHMLSISLSEIFLTLGFRYYSGIVGTTTNPGDTQVFVASMNVTYLFALGISVIPLLTYKEEEVVWTTVKTRVKYYRRSRLGNR